MVHRLQYGQHATLSLPESPAVQVAHCHCAAAALSDVTTAVIEALGRPLNYPPLHLATTPGDRVAIALDHAVPQPASIVAGVVHTLLKAGVEPGDMTFVLAEAGTAADRRHQRPQLDREDLLEKLPADVQREVKVQWHDSKSRKRLAYLAASRDAHPIYLNRQLVDADVVLPISTVTLSSSLGYLGVYGGLFPLFSDEQTMQRFRQPPLPDDSARTQSLKEQCDEAAWLLGALFVVQVVPGPAAGILQVLAGEAGAVERQGQQAATDNWLHHAPFRASLVVATIGGGPPQQTWRNFSRALFAAAGAAADNSDIVVCTQLQSAPGPITSPRAIRETAEGQSAGGTASDDTVSAAALEAARRHSRIFLLSNLDEDVVEDLGLAHVSDPDEISRLSRHHRTWLLLEDAQHAMVDAMNSPQHSL